MASLHYIYATMNSGKTTDLLQVAYNYRERKMHTLLLKPAIDNREGTKAIIRARIGLEDEATLFTPVDDLGLVIQDLSAYILEDTGKTKLDCVLIDEAQFLTPEQVQQLCRVVDVLDVPVMCYGLRTDFLGNLFPGSAALFAAAERIEEVRTICGCGSRATHVLRFDNGQVVTFGNQIQIGGNDTYEAVCRKCHSKALGRI